MFKSTAAAAAAAIAAGLTAAPALAREPNHSVVPYQSIGGIHLKWTPQQVRRHFGKPSATFHENGKISGEQYDDIQIDFDIFDKHDRAMDISGIGPGFHTIKGIHIGTSVTTLKHKLGGRQHFRCEPHIGCNISKGEPGALGSYQTSFGTENGKVSGFAVSYNFPDD
jgi:hypothetical protein